MKPAPFVSTRREFLATSGGLAAASVLARSAAAGVHVGGSDTIRVDRTRTRLPAGVRHRMSRRRMP